MKQKLLMAVDILLMVGIVGLIPLDLWVCTFPEWVILITAFALIALNVFYFVKFKTKTAAKIILPIFSILAICLSLFGSYCNPYWNSLLCRHCEHTQNYDTAITYAQAKADIDYMMHYLNKCHPLFMSGAPDEVQKSYDAAIARLQDADEITINTLRREMQNILSVLGDGHTTVWAYWDEYYLKTVPKRNAEGWKLVKINERTLQDIFEEKEALFSYEVESWGIEQISSEVCVLSGLDFLGLDPNGITYTWQNDEGEEETDKYTSSDFVPYDEYLEYNKAYLDDEEDEDFVSYKIDEEKSLALLTLTSCKYNEQYINCLKDMFTEVKAKKIRNVAVDIRGNGGGNSLVANEFIRYLDIDEYSEGTFKWRFGVFNISSGDGKVINQKYSDLTFDGDIFLLTDASSFSSSMLFAQFIKDNKLGTIIGEPPGNIPNCYGDISTFSMPNSGLCVQVSTKQFFRADKSNTDLLIMPDIECDGKKALDVLYEKLGK